MCLIILFPFYAASTSALIFACDESVYMRVATGSVENLKPEVVMHAFCEYLGMNMEEIPKGHLGPVGEEQCQHCSGDGKVIQETSYSFRLLENIKGNHQNIDAAKVKGKITPAKFA